MISGTRIFKVMIMNRAMVTSTAMGLVLGLALMGCGDDGSSSDETWNSGESSEAERFLMVPSGGTELEGEVTGDLEAQVFLYDKETGDPADNEPVSFNYLGLEEDEERPMLSSGTVYTEPDGSAAVDVVFGTEEGAWTLEADHESSNTVEFDLIAGPAESGMIDVSLVNPSTSIMELVDIDVRVYRQDYFDCDQFQPLGFPSIDPLAEDFAAFTGTDIQFDGLSTRNRYTVTAVARGDQGQIAAGACSSSLMVEHDEVTTTELILQLVPLNPTGIYDVQSNWDFTDALADSGPAGSVIVSVLDIFENPGQAIYDEIINLVSNLVGGIISGTIDTFLGITGLDTTFQNMIDDFIDGSDGLSQVRDAGQDLRNVVADLEVQSELSIGKLAQDFEFRGQDNWLGIVLYWTWDCDDDAPDDCGAIELLADSDGEIGDLGVLSSTWTGRVVAYNQLQIDQHPVSLRYGRLIMYVLNDVMLPAITDGNANSMSEAFQYWLGCESLANSLIPDGSIEALGFELEAQTIEDFCGTAVSTVFGFADILIDSLEFDMGLRVGGDGTLIEQTSNGVVDAIMDGHFGGAIEENDGDTDQVSTTSSFEATWDAERREQ